MRVAIDARYVDGKGSGIGSYTLNLARALLEEDPELELLLVFPNKKCHRLLEHPRVEAITFPVPPNSPGTWYLLGPYLRRQRQRRRFDLFHSPFAVAPLSIDTPLVITVHDLMWVVNPRFISNSPLFRLVVGAFYRRSAESAIAAADRVCAVSEATRRAIGEHLPWFGAKVRVTPNGVDRSRIFEQPDEEAFAAIRHVVEPGTPFVLTVGNNSPHKNHVNAVRGFLAAFADRPGYRMVLVRRFLRRDPEMRALAEEPRFRERVIALPHVTAAELNALYSAARIYLHPSYYEGFGIPLLEAMSAGTPVVTSRTSCMPEVAGDAALLVDPASPPEIATALRRLEDEPELRAELVQRGRRRLGRYTWGACARATLKVYRELSR